jgi:hypothetical protein
MFKKWSVSNNDLMFLTPEKARDLLIECFFTAQKETFAGVKEKTKKFVSDREIRTTVIAGVRAVFKEIGADFEHPKKKDLAQVVDILSAKAKSWGTPAGIIEHHKAEIGKVLEKLKDINDDNIES